MSAIVIRNGRIIDPANKRDEIADLFIADGKIAKEIDKAEVIDATGLIVAPGLIDIHVHFREPGFAWKETIESGARCAAAGGFTTVVCMPNTSPVADSPSTIALIKDRAAEKACVNVLPTGAISKNLAGEELAPIGSLAQAGVVAITDDGHCVQNNELMRRAVEYARMVGVPVLDHCQDYNLVGNGVVHEGYWSTLLGLPGWPSAGEEAIVARNILLAELCDHHIHCQHISAAGSVRLLREARARGVKISGEVCPHHLALTDESTQNFDTNYKINPPLRTQADIEALLAGIADGTLDILASDHAPHAQFEKEVEFDQAPFGILGLETELGLFLDLLVHKTKTIELPRLIEMFTANPARLLNLHAGNLSLGASADVTLIDPNLEWTYRLGESASLSRNSPFDGWTMKGRAVRTIVRGETVWNLTN
ncbi:MAG: dihydroorotase [Verrucomicrobiota bacterium]|nr:dihydroorotase [Verrucomicrobiota bacterium]MDQ6940126.1 dihydroorotase [Verrucomicrobiota bacterium]